MGRWQECRAADVHRLDDEVTQEQYDKMQGLSVEDVNGASRKHIHADKFVNIQAGDLKDAPPKQPTEVPGKPASPENSD